MSVNKTILLGRLGKDPEIKNLPNGQSVVNFSVATSKKYKDKQGEQKEVTQWHRIVVWGKLADLCHQYLSKGRQVYLEGELQTRSWEKDGEKRYSTEINAHVVQFIGKGDSQERPAPSNDFAPESNKDFASEDIPF